MKYLGAIGYSASHFSQMASFKMATQEKSRCPAGRRVRLLLHCVYFITQCLAYVYFTHAYSLWLPRYSNYTKSRRYKPLLFHCILPPVCAGSHEYIFSQSLYMSVIAKLRLLEIDVHFAVLRRDLLVAIILSYSKETNPFRSAPVCDEYCLFIFNYCNIILTDILLCQMITYDYTTRTMGPVP